MEKRGNRITSKKGQVAMEFLMTYGWAILIILIAVAALWLLGVFSPSTVNRCQVEAPFNCGEIRVEDGGANDVVTLTMGASLISGSETNNKISSVIVNGVNCNFGTGRIAFPDSDPTKDARTKQQQFSCTTASDIGGVGDKFNGIIQISFEKKGAGLTRTMQGEFAGEIEVPGTGGTQQNPNLIGSYTFDSRDATDSSGNGNDGTSAGTLDWTTGHAGTGSSLLKTTANGNIVLPQAISTITEDTSIEMWINPDVGTILTSYYPYESGYLRVQWIGGGTNTIGVYTPAGVSIVTSSSKPSGQWYHVVFTWDYTPSAGNGAYVLYVNGVVESQNTRAGQFTLSGTNNAAIGAARSGVSDFWGVIDNVKVYNKALSQAEVSAAYAAG